MTRAPIPTACEHPGCFRNAEYNVSWLFLTTHRMKTCADHVPPYAYSVRPINLFGPALIPDPTPKEIHHEQ